MKLGDFEESRKLRKMNMRLKMLCVNSPGSQESDNDVRNVAALHAA